MDMEMEMEDGGWRGEDEGGAGSAPPPASGWTMPSPLAGPRSAAAARRPPGGTGVSGESLAVGDDPSSCCAVRRSHAWSPRVARGEPRGKR